MDSRRGSSSRAPSPQPGDWRRCSVPHSELVTLQTEGYLPPAFMVPVRAGLATYKGGKQAESVPNPSKGERVCFVPYLIRGLGFPIHPFLQGAPGVLWTPTSPPHACLHFAHHGLCSSLRAVLGHRAPFCVVEEAVLPRTPFSRGVDISSGRSRSMAHRRDQISIRNPEEGVRRLAFGVVLYGRRPAAGPSSDRPPGV